MRDGRGGGRGRGGSGEPPKAFLDTMWVACAQAGGGDSPVARAAYAKTVKALFAQRVKAEEAGRLLAQTMAVAREAHGLTEDAFELLARCLEAQCAAIAGEPEPRDQAALLIETQAGLARMLHGCASMGRLAGIEDAPRTRDTVRRLDEATERREELLDQLRATGWRPGRKTSPGVGS